jgi:hypothetical protein
VLHMEMISKQEPAVFIAARIRCIPHLLHSGTYSRADFSCALILF